MAPQWDWLHELFGSYDLYYLDPWIVKDTAFPKPKAHSSFRQRLKFWQTPKPAWFTQDVHQLETLLSQIRKLLDFDGKDRDLSQFFEGGLQNKLARDRAKQREVVTLFLEAWTNKEINRLRKFENVNDLSEGNARIKDFANRNTVDALVFVDGMINRTQPDETNEQFQTVVVPQTVVDRYYRSVRFFIADRPWVLMGLDEHAVGLVVDQKALLKSYPNDARVDGPVDPVGPANWYPFARVIGFWRVANGGRPYIDVIAILIKMYPTLDQVFRPRAGGKRKFVKMIEDARDLAEQIKASLGAGARHEAIHDYSLAYPYLLAYLGCGLNHAKWDKFLQRSKELNTIFLQYEHALLKLTEEITLRQHDSVLPLFVGWIQSEEAKSKLIALH